MAATGKTPILLYGSTTTTNTPAAGNLTNSSDGCEIAINVADKNLFFKDSTNTVNTVPIRQSSASSNGWLSSTDWSTFNSKQPAGSYALTTGTLAQFASTTSAQLAGVISDETGTGALVFADSPVTSNITNTALLVNPVSSLVFTTSKFNSQGVAWSADATLNSYIFNGSATQRPEVSWYRGSRTYPEFSIRQHTTNDTDGEVYAGPGTVAPTKVAEIKAGGWILNALAVSGNTTFTGTVVTNGAVTVNDTINTNGLLSVAKGIKFTGSATLGSTNNQTWSYEYPVCRYYVGDGSGYSLAFSKRTGSATTDLVTIADAGNMTLNTGNLVIGTSGKGIDFSATSDGSGTATNELLADYEEGTWTPAYTASSGAYGTIGYSLNTGTYTKVGRLVTVSAFMMTSSVVTGTAAGQLTVSGLPYTPKTGQLYSGSIGVSTGFLSDVNPDTMIINSGSNILLYYRTTSSGGSGQFGPTSGTGLVTGASKNVLYFSFTYEV